MDVALLESLVAVVDSGSVLGAARSQGVPRSLLRRRLDALEAAVGVPLLYRDAGGARLTAAGTVVLAQGRALIESSRTLVADARAADGLATGVVRIYELIGTPVSFRARTMLAGHSAFPLLRVVVSQVEDPLAYIHEPCELLLHEGEPPPSNTWFSRVLIRDRVRLLASPAYLERRGTPTTVQELVQHDLLAWKRPGRRPDAWQLRGGGTISVAPWLVSPDLAMLHSLARQGGGILYGPHTPFFDEPNAKPLVPIMEELFLDELLFRASSPLPARADSRTRGALEMLYDVLAGFPAV